VDIPVLEGPVSDKMQTVELAFEQVREAICAAEREMVRERKEQYGSTFKHDQQVAIEQKHSQQIVGAKLMAEALTRQAQVSDDAAVERLRELSSSVGAGYAEGERDPLKLIERIAWGVEHIQQVEAQRAADLIEELSKTPKTTWGAVKTAVLERAGPALSATNSEDAGPLVEFFRGEGFKAYGHKGDYEMWSTEETAVHFLREHLACRTNSEAVSEPLQAADRVIEYAAERLWNGRGDAIQQRPASIDADLRTFKDALAKLGSRAP
jgi:hypothetical protein